MLTLYYDVETTGLPGFREPAEHHEKHCGVAQLAAALVDESGVIRSAINLIFKQPPQVRVSESAIAIHGIGFEQMDLLGVSPKLATRLFLALALKADKLCAHNQKFDQKMMRIEMHRNGYGEVAEAFRSKPVDCTMEMADRLMKMAPTERMLAAGFTKSKPPKLEEAYLHFTGKPMQNAHDAWADVMATIEVHRAILNYPKDPEGEPDL